MVPLEPTMAIPRRKDRHKAAEFGALVRRWRKAKGLSVRDMARKTGIPHATWSRGERGLLDLRRWDYIIPLAGALELSLEEVAKLAEVESPPEPRFTMKAGEPRIGVGIRFTVSAVESLGVDNLQQFKDVLSGVMEESYERNDPTMLREIIAYAKGLLARSSSGGRKRRKPAPL